MARPNERPSRASRIEFEAEQIKGANVCETPDEKKCAATKRRPQPSDFGRDEAPFINGESVLESNKMSRAGLAGDERTEGMRGRRFTSDGSDSEATGLSAKAAACDR